MISSLSCLDIWRREQELPRIITLCRELDKELGGGVEIGKITEFCGSSGTGKTQLCLQLCINVQFPREVGGLGGKAVYIDTKQGFHPARLKEIADYMEERFQRTSMNDSDARPAKRRKFDSELLQNVSYVYCASYVQLLATLILLKAQLEQDDAIRLIVVDSFAFPLRNIDAVGERTSVVAEIRTTLQRFALDFSLAIVITNELTTRISCNRRYRIVPSLGDTHAHQINQRVLLNWNKETGKRMAAVGKTAASARPPVLIKIKKSGVRSVY